MSEDAPPCPDCESDLFVGRDKANDIDYRCYRCGQRWST